MPAPIGRKATYTLNQIQRKTRCDKVAQRLDQTPNGKWCVVAVLFATMAWILSLCAPVPCSYVQRNVKLTKEISDSINPQVRAVLFESHGVGFWGWSAQGQCLSFEISGKKPTFGGMYTAASASSTLNVFFGGAGMVCLWLGTCFPFRPQRFQQFGLVLIAAILFSGLTDLIFVSSVCQADFFQYVAPTITLADSIESSCSLGLGSLLNIFAMTFLFVAAIICELSPLSKNTAVVGRTTTQALPPSGDSDRLVDRFDDEEFDDDASGVRLQRKLETERRYREMFPDEDPDADDSILGGGDDSKPFTSGNTFGTLEPVREEVSEHLIERGNGLKGFDDDDDDDADASKGSRSRGSKSRGSRSRGSRSRNSRPSHYNTDDDGSRGSRGSHSRDDRSRGSRSYYSGDDEDRSRESRDSRSRGSRSHYSDDDRSYSGDDRSRSGRGGGGSHYSRGSQSRRSDYDDHDRDDRSRGSRSYFSRDDDRSKGERSELV